MKISKPDEKPISLMISLKSHISCPDGLLTDTYGCTRLVAKFWLQLLEYTSFVNCNRIVVYQDMTLLVMILYVGQPLHPRAEIDCRETVWSRLILKPFDSFKSFSHEKTALLSQIENIYSMPCERLLRRMVPEFVECFAANPGKNGAALEKCQHISL